MRCLLLIVVALLTGLPPSNAQSSPAEPRPAEATVAPENSGVEMADVMRQSGKIYVVVAVILLIFSGMIIYLFRIDRNVSKLEKELL